MYVYCDDIDTFSMAAKKANVEIVNEPETMCWGDRTCLMTDLNGHSWTFATKVAEFSAEETALA